MTKKEQLKEVFRAIAKQIWKDGILRWDEGNEPNYFDNRADELLKEVTIRTNL